MCLNSKYLWQYLRWTAMMEFLMQKLGFVSSQDRLLRKIPILKRERGSKYTFGTKRLPVGQTK